MNFRNQLTRNLWLCPAHTSDRTLTSKNPLKPQATSRSLNILTTDRRISIRTTHCRDSFRRTNTTRRRMCRHSLRQQRKRHSRTYFQTLLT